MVGADIVVAQQGAADGGGDRLLPDIAVRGALDVTFREQIRRALLEDADAQHRSIQFLELLGFENAIAFHDTRLLSRLDGHPTLPR